MKQCKHKFTPRYNEIYSTPLLDLKKLLSAHSCDKVKTEHNQPYLREKTYICDVCVKCGKIVGGPQ